MAIDPSIPLSIRVPKFDTPYELRGGALSLKQLMDETAMRPLEFQLRQEQLRGLQDYRAQMMEARAEDRRLRLLQIRSKGAFLFADKAKAAMANALGLFAFRGPEAAKQSYRREMMPLWQAVGYTPEQIEQSTQAWSPERVQWATETPEGQDTLLKMGMTAVQRNPQLMTDTGELVFPESDEGFQKVGIFARDPSKPPEFYDWLDKAETAPETLTPEEKLKIDALISASRLLKKEGGMTGKVEDNEYIVIPGAGQIKNPYYAKSQKEKQEREINAAIEKAKRFKAAGLKQPGSTDINIYPDHLQAGKAQQGRTDEQLFNTTAKLQRLNAIIGSFKPEFQVIQKRFGAAVAQWKAKLGGKLDKNDQQLVSDFARFKRRSFEDFNSTLKELSGAAVTPQEYDRLKEALPNPGEGIFDGDDPVSFASKLEDVFRQTKMAQARLMYLKRNGVPISVEAFENVPLERIPGLINSRGAELEKEYKKQHPSMSEKEIRREVRATLAQEFGLVGE